MRPVAGPVPARLVDRYGLDTRWYGRHADAWGLPVLAPHHAGDAVLERVRDRLGSLLRTHPRTPIAELDRRDVRVVVVPDGEPVTAVPEAAGLPGGPPRGATDTFPLIVSTESGFVDGFGHTLHRMALRHIAPAVSEELAGARRAAQRLGRWLNTRGGGDIDDYFAHGLQIYFDVAGRGPIGGDGVRNHIGGRNALRAYDRPLHRVLDRLYQGVVLPR